MITMSEIARLTNVSQPTVSRVLNGNPSVNPEVRERVLACAREHHYQPNALAKSLQGQPTHLLGVLLTDISNGFFAELAKEIEMSAKQAGYSILLWNSNYEPERERECFDVLRRYRVDGVIAVPCRADDEFWTRGTDALDFPLVIATLRVPGRDCVYVDHAMAGSQAARCLISRGYDAFAFAGTPGEDKQRGFLAELSRNGIAPERCFTADVSRDGWADVLAGRTASREERTGIFTSNDLQALELLNRLHAHGVTVPQRAGVLGFDDIPVSRYLTPSLSSMRQPLREMAAHAVGQLVCRIETPDRAVPLDLPLYASVIARESTG